MSSKIAGDTSMEPLPHPGHRSTTRAAVVLPFPWIVIHFPQLAPLLYWDGERATTASLSPLFQPQAPSPFVPSRLANCSKSRSSNFITHGVEPGHVTTVGGDAGGSNCSSSEELGKRRHDEDNVVVVIELYVLGIDD